MSHLIELYTKEACPVCKQAKDLLDAKKILYWEYEIGFNISREEVLSRFPNAKVVPVIVYNGQVMGGVSELQNLVESGVL